MHTLVAATVAEGKHRLTTDLFRNVGHFVHFLVFFGNPIRSDHLVFGSHLIGEPRFSVLSAGIILHIRADDLSVRNIQIVFQQHTTGITITAAAYIDSKVILLQVFDHLHHRLEEGIPVQHT